MTKTRLILATHNAGKRREWQALLDGLDIDILLPHEAGASSQVDETGDTYAENALLKAHALVERTGLPALADDSGLEVDALEGAPGLHSARYTLGSDEVRYRALLKAIDGVPVEQRGARFRCVAALVLADGSEFTTEGVCEGTITTAPTGEGGFGYDPVFFIEGEGCTMAELPTARKNQISHRARAAQAIKPVIKRELGV